MLPCNFGGTPVFWNPVPAPGSVSRMCAEPGCFDLPNFRSELSSAEPWFVGLAYRTYAIDVRNPDVNNSAVIQYLTFGVIESIAIECVEGAGCA